MAKSMEDHRMDVFSVMKVTAMIAGFCQRYLPTSIWKDLVLTFCECVIKDAERARGTGIGVDEFLEQTRDRVNACILGNRTDVQS